MKKTILIIAKITAIIIVFAHYPTFVWVIVSFFLYLFKDIPFNWWSIVAFIFFKSIEIYSILLVSRNHKSRLSERIEKLEQRTESDK